MNILFVCLGNICRSPMAEFILKDYLNKRNIKNVNVQSAGLHDEHFGEYMHFGTEKVLKRHDIKPGKFSSKMIDDNLFNNSDYIFVMDDRNYQDIIEIFGNNKKIRKITDYCTNGFNYVPDPWYTMNFEQVFTILDNCIVNIINDILK